MSNKRSINEGFQPSENRGFQPQKKDNGYQPSKSIKTNPPITPPPKKSTK